MRLTDYIKVVYPNSNNIRSIFSLTFNGNELDIIIGEYRNATEKKKIIFNNVLNYKISGVETEEDKELPQSIIGFDYWKSDNENLLNWEINGDGCTWDFQAGFPVISNVD